MKHNYMEGISIRNGRKENMDGLLLSTKQVGGQEIRLAAVCDGVGSTEDGAFAAVRTLENLKIWFDILQDRDYLGLAFLNAVRKIGDLVSEDIQKRELEAATTMSAILLTNESYYIVHAGDSRIYGWNGRNCIQLTQDMVSENGKLCSYIGTAESAKFEYYEGNNEMSVYLICSDGLYKKMDREFLGGKLKKIGLKNMKKIEQELVDHVIAKGEKDNITIALLINEGWDKNED